MKTIRCILLLLLSVVILFVGRGVDIVRCAHSGTVTMMACLPNETAHDDKEPMQSCMSVEHVEVSPTILQPTVDFQAIQPLVAILPVLQVVLQPTILDDRQRAQTDNVVSESPPRSYLYILCTLLI